VTQTGISPAAADAEARIFAKIGWRLMPVLILSYILNYLDRNNVGFAGLTMNQAIGLTAAQLGFGAGVFFAGYCLLEIPSNLVLYRVGARVWLSRIMISWGLRRRRRPRGRPEQLLRAASAAWSAEAGFFPGVAFYLGTWFPVAVPDADDRVVHGRDSRVVGDRRPDLGWLLDIDGFGGLQGWQWMFHLEGLPVCSSACACCGCSPIALRT
jgi:hypothetical protein